MNFMVIEFDADKRKKALLAPGRDFCRADQLFADKIAQ
jgi:hypothetical protein